MMQSFDFGLVGLGVMGRNFILNVAEHGFSAYGLDTDAAKVQDLKHEAGNLPVDGTTDKATFLAALSSPRKIMLLVPAGAPVDAVINDFLPHLQPGDILIDGGNSYFADTDRREAFLAEKGIHFLGIGVSGGAAGARRGPSMMPGGNRAAYQQVQPILEAVAAKVGDEPCVTYLGPKSAGNYVKMIHNGIEYAIMQLISEVYQVLKHNGMTNAQLGDLFGQWNQGRLQSFLIEITHHIFQKKDTETGQDLVDLILDKAKQKGTGKWTSQNAMDLGIAIPTVDAAVSARVISSLKTLRGEMGAHYPKPAASSVNLDELSKQAEEALFFGILASYAQGFAQLQAASEAYSYGLELEGIAKIWRGGCIIRAAMLEQFRQAYAQQPNLPHLFQDAALRPSVQTAVAATRPFLGLAIAQGLPTLGLSTALAYFDALTSPRLPLNLVQAQRDFFGSHTYERTDRDGIFHTEWE